MINWQLSKQLTSIIWPYRGLKCRPIEVEYFFWSYPLTNYKFQMIAGSSLFFPMLHIKSVVFMSLWPCTVKILISNRPRTRKFCQFLKKYRRGRPFLTMFTRWSLRPMFVLWSVKIWQVSSCVKFMQHLESCLLWQLKLAEFCVNLWCFITAFFHWMCKMKYSGYQESSVIHGWFVYWVFGWEMRRLSKFGIPISDGIFFVFHLA